jgi:hypothetical protein
MNIDRLNSMTSRIAARLRGKSTPQADPQAAAPAPLAAQPALRQARLHALRALPARDPEQELEMLSLTLRLEPDTDLRPALSAFNAAHPANAGGLYLAGVAHLKQDDAGGLALLDRAMELDHEAVPAACEHAHNFLAAHGDTALAERYALRARLHAAFDGLDAADADR